MAVDVVLTSCAPATTIGRRDTMHRNVALVVAAGRDMGLEVEPKEFAESTRTAAEAAAAIGVELGQIVKSLVFTVDDRPVIALVSGDRQLDESKLAVAAGGSRCARADANLVRDATGFPVGGVPPFGHATTMRVFVDNGLLRYDEVWAAAGTPHVNFALSPHQLVEATGARVVDVTRA
jgi:Cys-tRNA(Pro) deacylase